jgi:ADP-heptose:LPS heptosyltransferase
MGDVVLATAVLPLLAERYPRSVIEFVTQRPYHELFAGDPRLHRVLVYDRAAGALEQPPGPEPWDLVIVARADQVTTEPKLRRAGATRVISLYRIAGHRIAAQLRNPRVADFLELGELMCRDALAREESCGGHFREEYQTEDAEATRNDADFAHAARAMAFSRDSAIRR